MFPIIFTVASIHGALIWPLIWFLVFAGVCWCFIAYRSIGFFGVGTARRDAIAFLREVLPGITGLPFESVQIKWKKKEIRSIALKYSLASGQSPKFLETLKSAILTVASGLEIESHNRVLGEIVFASAKEKVAESEDVKMLKKTAGDLFGAGSSCKVETDAGGKVQKVLVHHDLGAKVGGQNTRAGIEAYWAEFNPGSRWKAFWDLPSRTVQFVLRKELPKKIDNTPYAITPETENKLRLAFDEDLKPIWWDLKGNGPHLMTVGKTGTGKTVAINGVIAQIAHRGWQVWLADPKRIEFLGWRNKPNIAFVATQVQQMVATVMHIHKLMEERYSLIEAGQADESDFEPVFLVLDEYRNFHRQVEEWYAGIKVKGDPSKCPVFSWIPALAEKARSARIHLIIGTQRPDAEFFDGSMRDNFDTRLSMGRLSPQGAQMMWESVHAGTTVPRRVRGRGTALGAGEKPVEVQVPWTPDPRRAERDAAPADKAILEAFVPDEVKHKPQKLEFDETFFEDSEGGWSAFTNLTFVDALGEEVQSAVESSKEPIADVVVEKGFDPFDGYGSPERCGPEALKVGDLFEEDGLWVTVTESEEVEEGFAISWVNDDGEVGVCVFDEDANVNRRLATESEEGALV